MKLRVICPTLNLLDVAKLLKQYNGNVSKVAETLDRGREEIQTIITTNRLDVRVENEILDELEENLLRVSLGEDVRGFSAGTALTVLSKRRPEKWANATARKSPPPAAAIPVRQPPPPRYYGRPTWKDRATRIMNANKPPVIREPIKEPPTNDGESRDALLPTYPGRPILEPDET